MRFSDGFVGLAIVIAIAIKTSEAIKCFECSGVPFPRDCSKITTCNEHELCVVEQYVISAGAILYNSGCLDKQRCSGSVSALVGKRNKISSEDKRSTDIATCLQCCDSDFCNKEGCGATDVPRDQRGPYCFTCDATVDPAGCNHVSICSKYEVCAFLVPKELHGLPETVYRGQCQSKASCDVIEVATRNLNCPVHCCDTDFCNDHCGTVSNGTITTPQPDVTHVSMTTQPVVGTAQPMSTTMAASTIAPSATHRPSSVATCKTDHYYDYITGMCIRLFDSVKGTWEEAKQACEAIGDQLVAPDSHEKNVFVETIIQQHSNTLTADRNFWIGAHDKGHSHFTWPNGNRLNYTYWGGGNEVVPNRQPDGHNQDCVMMYGPDSYRWNDDVCSNSWHYICEDPRTLNPVRNTECKSGHFYDSVTGMCIMIGEQGKLSHAEARSVCHHLGDRLAVIDNHDKTIFVENMLIHHSVVYPLTERLYYIGLSYHRGDFIWPDGVSVHYTNWGGGDEVYTNRQPDNGKVDQCVAVLGNDHYQWHDVRCEQRAYYICEDKDTLKSK